MLHFVSCPHSILLAVPVPFHCSETTDADKFDMVLELIADVGRVMFKLFQHPSLAIVKAAGLIMKSIIEVCTHAHTHVICLCVCLRMFVCLHAGG